MGDEREAYWVLVGKPEGRLEDIIIDGRIVLQ